jgi:DNA repair protein RadA/Sms
MAKDKTIYTCTECGGGSPRWLGRCPHCEAWNTLIESVAESPSAAKNRFASLAKTSAVAVLADIETSEIERTPTGIAELDRVLGGGIVEGGVVLIGGDPGIGKSTLLLQALDALQRAGVSSLYVTGEESGAQVALRSRRLGLHHSQVKVLAEIQLEKILATIAATQPAVAVIDSIQTVYSDQLTSAPGSVAQVREAASRLLRVAKESNVATFLVGHVTKDGAVAGPRVLEHLVDCVLQFEGDRYHAYRILRAVKNRFGSTNELGVFEMTGEGLVGVPDPSALFGRSEPGEVGAAVACTLEGTRPILLEIQALVAQTDLAMPRRVATGVDPKRLAMIVAVLARHGGLPLGGADVFVNTAGGVRIDEPGADLGIALAIASAARNVPVREGLAAFGELGLTGRLRPATQGPRRVEECRKLGLEPLEAETLRQALKLALSEKPS